MFLNQFIIYYFVHIAKLKNILYLHCWSTASLPSLAQLNSQELLYAQYLSLDDRAKTLDQHLQTQLVEHGYLKLGVYFDINCNQSAKIMQLANNQRLFTDQYHWLIYDKYFNLIELKERFTNAELFLHTELSYVQSNLKDDNFILYDLYNKAKHLGSKLNITIDQQIACNVSDCHVSAYLSELHTRTRLQQRRDLHGITLRINAPVTVLPADAPQSEIIAFFSSESDVEKDPFPRLGYHTFEVLRSMFNCNYSYIYRGSWSDSELTGGLIGDILNGSVDLTATAFLFTPRRAEVLKLLNWFSSFRSVCLFRNPQSARAELRVKEFVQPFSLTVWLLFAGTLLLAGLLLWLTFHLEYGFGESTSSKPSLLTSCLLSFGAACNQGAWILPNSTGGRMVFFAVMFTCFLMYNYYTSVVVSTLLGSPPKSNIRTIQQLADSNLEVTAEPAIYTKVYLETAEYADIRSLYRKKLATAQRQGKKIWLHAEEGTQLVRNKPGFVYITEAATAYEFIRRHYLPHEICGLNEILLRDETNAHTTVLKSSSFIELIKQSHLRSLETGVHLKWFRYWVRSKLHCFQSNETVVVGLNSAGPLFLLLLIAYIICLFIFGLEVMWHRRQQRVVVRH